jgi:hypothetical protein
MPDKPDLAKEVAELREVVAENITDLMTSRGLNDRSLEKQGVPRNSLNRARRGVAGANLDTLAMIADALGVQPALLLMRGGAKHVSEVFRTPAPDARLGSGWTRPDRQPLLQSGRDTQVKSSKVPASRQKIKSR